MSSFSSAILADPRLVGYWRINDGASTGVVAETAYRYDIYGVRQGIVAPGPALISADPSAASGVFTTGYITVIDVLPLRIVGNLTLLAWISPSSASETAHIIGKRSGGIAAPYTLGLSGGVLSFAVGNGSTQTVVTGTAPPVASPSLVGATLFRRSMVLYLNGVATTLGTVNVQILDGGQPLVISSASSPFSGLISEVALFNGALSGRIMQRLFNLGRQIHPDPAHYRLVEPPVMMSS